MFTKGHKINVGRVSWNRGGTIPKEQKRKISENHKCKKPDFIHPLKGKVGPMKGKHHSQETIEKMRERFKGKPISEEHKKKISDYWKNNKPKHPNWKGGITPLYNLIRHLEENKNWRDTIFKRDNYTCQECGKKGKIQAHHIKRFNIILKEFLQVYSQFSPIEDKETLVRLAINYQPFWDITNGKTLCNDCHDLTRNFIIRPQDIRKAEAYMSSNKEIL